ncbi:MAG: 1-(5-phosphoribosyl)-5-[(5-phosphoribosylamino)methylideneamino]imidazole-4-carboxamide isomerase [Alphaproteobacteria bacterium]
MIIYPAIDLKDGKCVRLVQGRMEDATIFNDDPAAQAMHFQQQGATWLHMVDLNGAFEGRAVNGDAVKSILESTHLKTQLGGGIRTLQQAEYWLNQGLSRIILGTAMVKDPEFAKACCHEFPDQVVLGIDSNDNKLAICGWAEQTDITIDSFLDDFKGVPAAAIIHTDIARDGAMQGVNLAAMTHLADIQPIPVIASGGVTTLDDVHALKHSNKIAGVIIGRALYEGSVDLTEALAV